jgi:hypothetical protein
MSIDDELTSGWRYFTTLQLRTPLKYLELDGQFCPGSDAPPLVGPPTGMLEDGTEFNPYGCWVRVIDYDSLGWEPPALGRRAAQGGMVEIGSTEEAELLSFMKSFRFIIETAESIDQALAELDELKTSNPSNSQIWARFTETDPEWHIAFLVNQLADQLPSGLGLAKAKQLYGAGFRCIDEIRSASDEQLLKIPGLGKGILKKLRDSL